ncbi:hypothetical protein DFH06DRAFT_1484348 [Mycena polygramma]|nr:hypothetical protein DFH06DRAFT_1484348 [Mycena polygramma]
MTGTTSWQKWGRDKHMAGEAEIQAAEAQALVQGTVDPAHGKMDAVVGAVTGDRARQVEDKEERVVVWDLIAIHDYIVQRTTASRSVEVRETCRKKRATGNLWSIPSTQILRRPDSHIAHTSQSGTVSPCAVAQLAEGGCRSHNDPRSDKKHAMAGSWRDHGSEVVDDEGIADRDGCEECDSGGGERSAMVHVGYEARWDTSQISGPWMGTGRWREPEREGRAGRHGGGGERHEGKEYGNPEHHAF